MSFVDVTDARVEQSNGPIGLGDRPYAPRTIRNYFGRARETHPGPQGFLVEFSGATEVGPHFHSSDQFQVFTGTGTGSFYQRHALDTLHVHFSDAFSTYGPFGTDGSPLSLLTLRETASDFTAYLPRDRHMLVKRGRRNVDVAVGELASRALPPGESSVDVVLSDDDGLAVVVARGGPGAQLVLPPAGASRGEYLWVADGVVVDAATGSGRAYPSRSLGWFGPDERLSNIETGDEGATVLVLRFPRVAEVAHA